MMPRFDQNANAENPPELLPDLADGLRRLYATSPQVPADRDAEVREAIGAHFAPRPLRHPLRRTLAWSAVAAAAAVAISGWLLTINSQPTRPVSPGVAQAGPADVDRNGRVDILDAYSLARRIESQSMENAAADINGDGAVDGLDVDAIALRAVSLNGGASS